MTAIYRYLILLGMIILLCTGIGFQQSRIRVLTLETAYERERADQATDALADSKKSLQRAEKARSAALARTKKLQEKPDAKLDSAMAGPARDWADARLPDSVLDGLRPGTEQAK